MNKKAEGGSDTAIILMIATFQAILVLCLGFINVGAEVTTYDGGVVSDFTMNVITNIKELGWFNTVLFIPLELVIIYIIAKLIRGV